MTVVYALPFEPVVPLVRRRSILGPGPDLAGGGPGARATCTPPPLNLALSLTGLIMHYSRPTLLVLRVISVLFSV